ncbi:MAG: FAD-dependent oxidoreductase [Caulobacteraceae bacterium]
MDLPGLHAVLDLAVMDVADALEAWDGRADAWFLDGFSPAKNPQMWSEAVLALVAARSAPGARAATFTVAGAVRRGLQAAGFTVSKQPGFGRKAERLEATLPGPAPRPAPPGTVAIVGAGIAGAALARAFRAQGVEPMVFDARGAAAGASGNPAALVTPRLDAGGGPAARLHGPGVRPRPRPLRRRDAGRRHRPRSPAARSPPARRRPFRAGARRRSLRRGRPGPADRRRGRRTARRADGRRRPSDRRRPGDRAPARDRSVARRCSSRGSGGGDRAGGRRLASGRRGREDPG